jgi:hypothetical protein
MCIYDAVNYLNYAISLAPLAPDGSVLKYALRSLVSQKLQHSAQAAVVDYALNLSYHQPILLPVLDSLLETVLPGKEIKYADRLQSIAWANAKHRRSDGLAWSLYYLTRHGIGPSDCLAKEIIESDDCVGLLFLYLSGVSRYQQQVIDAATQIAAKEPYDKDRYWLLLYELFREGKIADPYPGEQIFGVLRSLNVCFYQTGQA